MVERRRKGSTPLISDHFRLGKDQSELDFVNIPVNADILLFIDPFAISQRPDRWSQDCHRTVIDFFERVVKAIIDGDHSRARSLLLHLREPNETRFGFSKGRPQGAGIGRFQAEVIFQSLCDSSAVTTGFLKSLEECELMVQGIGRDKLSDLTTNIIRYHLAEYTLDQCELWGIPTSDVPLPPFYSPEDGQWHSDYFKLPVTKRGPVLLIPKFIARFDPAYDHQSYYRHYVLNFLQAEHLDAHSSLVHTLKNGKRVVYKRDVAREFPCTKENLYQFSKAHPEVLKKYREYLKKLEARTPSALIEQAEEPIIAEALIEALKSIPPGSDHASDYHNLMIGIVEFVFYPNLIHPSKEREIHQGRKRIDIVMENGAKDGIFHRLPNIQRVPCAYVPIECKNYGAEVANPELDQLSGRFSTNRGTVGLLCCRQFDERERFVNRCRDTFKDGRGLILPFDDQTIQDYLELILSNKRSGLERRLSDLVAEIALS